MTKFYPPWNAMRCDWIVLKWRLKKNFGKFLIHCMHKRKNCMRLKQTLFIYRLGDYGDSDTFFVIGDENAIVLSRKIHLS